jgi:hypothetical protein
MAPAWNCRSWTVKKLHQRSYKTLNFLEKIQKLMIPLREHIWFRAISCLPGRFYDELRLLTQKPIDLRYKSLHPRWDLIEEFDHVSDDDAASDIDPHSAICFFKSRNYEIVSHPTWISRMAARHEPVIVRKKIAR